MLRTRIITAVVLLPLAWLAIFKAAPHVFVLIAAGVLMIGSWEFRRLAGLETHWAGWLLLVVQAGLFWWLGTNVSLWTANPGLTFQVACLAWLPLFLQLRFFNPDATVGATWRLRGFINALVSISIAWMALSWLRFEPHGSWWILIMFLSIWSSDIGAYFTGKALGKHRMSPRISPKKTWEGLAGGLLAAAIIPTGAVALIPAIDAPLLPVAIICVVTALVSVGGDLFISMHKRTVGCKDTGRILPGHGGVLDRLDSTLAGAPFFALGMILAGL